MIHRLTAEDYSYILRHDLRTFIERSFYELNPATRFEANWHIDVIASKLEQCRLTAFMFGYLRDVEEIGVTLMTRRSWCSKHRRSLRCRPKLSKCFCMDQIPKFSSGW